MVWEVVVVWRGWATGVYFGAVMTLFGVGFWADDVARDPGRVVGVVVGVGAAAGLLFGLVTGWESRRRWPTGAALGRAERRTVARTVLQGDSPTDPRLAPAVLELARSQRDRSERATRPGGGLLSVGIMAVLVVTSVAGDRPLRALVIVVAVAAIVLTNVPRRKAAEEIAASARASETAVQKATSPGDTHPG